MLTSKWFLIAAALASVLVVLLLLGQKSVKTTLHVSAPVNRVWSAITNTKDYEQWNMSAPYLSDLLKKETGKAAQQHIQDNIIDQAKTPMLATNEQVSQIAYALGFEYPQHFSKLFKKRTGLSPAQYRKIN